MHLLSMQIILSECAGDDRQYAGAFRNTFVSGCVLLQFFLGEKTENISILIKLLGVSIGILGVIGISQFFGFDLLSMGFVKEFLGGRKARVSHFIYLTLYHWNYVGSYVSLLLPVTVAMIVYFHEAGKKRERTFWFVLFYLLIFCLFGSQSRTGTLAVLVSFCIGGVKYRNKVCQYKKTILCVLVSVLAILFSATGTSQGIFLENGSRFAFLPKEVKSYLILKRRITM